MDKSYNVDTGRADGFSTGSDLSMKDNAVFRFDQMGVWSVYLVSKRDVPRSYLYVGGNVMRPLN